MTGGKKVGAKGKVTKPHLVPVFMRLNLSSSSVHYPSFLNLRRTTPAELVVLNSHWPFSH